LIYTRYPDTPPHFGVFAVCSALVLLAAGPAGDQDQRGLETAGAQERGDNVQDLLILEEMDEAVDAVGKALK
jgi:hypothetical protein